MLKTYVILHNIRSAFNVGSIFRTADGAGVTKIYLTGITPAPIDRFGRARLQIIKTSLGAAEFVLWEQVPAVEELIEQLKEKDVRLVSVEQHNSAISYRAFQQTGDTAYIFGGEIDGVPETVLDVSDTILEIPMHGKKESLNVGVTAGIILYQVRAD